MPTHSKAKYFLATYHCGKCSTGIVQILQTWKRGGTVTSLVSGCLDCKHEYGLYQAERLNLVKPNTATFWP